MNNNTFTTIVYSKKDNAIYIPKTEKDNSICIPKTINPLEDYVTKDEFQNTIEDFNNQIQALILYINELEQIIENK